MQVNNSPKLTSPPSIIQNRQITTTPSFQAIKVIEGTGLYKKNPVLVKELIETMKQNPKIMEFCKKYDVRVYFHAFKDNIDGVNSSIHIFYDNITKGKIRKFFESLGTNPDHIQASAYSRSYGPQKSLYEATEKLQSTMFPVNKKGSFSGRIERLLEEAHEAMTKSIKKQDAKAIAKKEKAAQKVKEAEIAKLEAKKLYTLVEELKKETTKK